MDLRVTRITNQREESIFVTSTQHTPEARQRHSINITTTVNALVLPPSLNALTAYKLAAVAATYELSCCCRHL